MDRKKLFKLAAHLIVFIFLVNYVAVKLSWYNSIWYFDMIMHFLGGLWVGLISLYFFSPGTLPFYFVHSIFKILLSVLFIGLGWEIFEVVFNNIIAQNPFNTLDTISDIFFDLSGGFCAIIYVWRKLQKKIFA